MKLGIRNIKGKVGQKIIEKANLTADQMKALDKGYNTYMDILDHKKALKGQLKGAKEAEKVTLEDKIGRLNEVLKAFTRGNIDKMKELSAEYDKLYPDDFNE